MTQPLHRLLALTLALAFLIAGCAAPPAPSASSGGPAATAAAAKPIESVIWEVVGGDSATLDPPRINSVLFNSALRLFYEPLFTFVGSDVSKAMPHLATGATSTPDYKTWTIKLRSDVKFADGTPMTSADVKFTFDRLVNMKDKAAAFFLGFSTAAPDPTTVVITSPTPYPAMPVTLTSYVLGITNSKLVKANGGTDAADADKSDKATPWMDKNTAGSGPYLLDSFVPGTRLSAVPNPNYWGANKPLFKQVVITNTPGASQLLDIQKGVATISMDLTTKQAKSVNLAPSADVPAGLQLNAGPALRMFNLTFNIDPVMSPVGSNADFRRAFRDGLDYDALLKLAGEGAVQPPSVVPGGILGALPQSEAPKRDVAKAKMELARSGLVNPTINLSFPSDTPFNGLVHQDFAELMQSNLKEVGINVVLDTKPNITSFAQFNAGYNGVYLATTTKNPDPDASAIAFCPGAVAPNNAGQARWKIGMDPETDRLCAMARSAGPDTRAAAYQAMQRRMNDLAVYIMILQPPYNVIADKRLKNVVYSPGHFLDWYTVGR